MPSVNKFEQALQNTLNDKTAVTENGAAAFATSGRKLLDMNFAVGSLRNKSEAEVAKMFSEAYYEDPLLAVKWMFMLRDIRGNGMGERLAFRICMKWLASVRPDVVKKLIGLVAEYGRFDDLFCLVSMKEADVVEDEVLRVIDEQWAADVKSMKTGKPISLLAKWLPSCNASSKKTVALARFFCKKLALSEKQYRKALSAMRKHLDVVERKMSAKQWSEIDYEAVPSMANVKYRDAFLRNDEERRRAFLGALEKGAAKVNASAAFPSDIVHAYAKNVGHCCYGPMVMKADPALEAMWKALPDYAKGLESGSTVCVCDSSGSMECTVGGTSMTAMEVAYSLGIYFSEKLTGPFKGKTITFSHSPQYLDMSKAETLAEKLNVMYSHSEVANTNIEAVFDLLLETAVRNGLKQSDIPANVLVISDMEMDQAVGHRRYGVDDENEFNASQTALFKLIEQKWNAAGYDLPRLVFWNVNSRTGGIPLQTSSSGVALVSGYSPAIAKMVFSAKLDPYEVLAEAVNAPRYQAVEDAVKSCF